MSESDIAPIPAPVKVERLTRMASSKKDTLSNACKAHKTRNGSCLKNVWHSMTVRWTFLESEKDEIMGDASDVIKRIDPRITPIELDDSPSET